MARTDQVTAVIYCRISHDRNGDQAGVERQRKDCWALAKELGLKVDHVYTDNDVSATSGKVRPQFEAMLSAPPAAIITWHQDRLLRLTSDLEKVIALDVPVYTVTAGTLDLTTPAGRAVARTVAAWSTYEGEQKATRQRAANVQRAEAGVWQFSRRPYGYERRDGRVRIIETEAAIVREGYRRYLDGESYYEIANDWNERGVPTFTGPWSMARVRSMLRNERYAGLASYKGERVEPDSIEWEPLLDRQTWDAYVRMRMRRKTPHDWSNQTKYLLSGLARCGECGAAMFARPDHGVMKYSCTTNWCTSRTLADVDALVGARLVTRFQDPKIVARLRQAPDTAPHEEELSTLRRRRDDLAALLAEGVLSRAAVREQAATLTARIDRLQARLDALRADDPVTDLALAESVVDRWDALPLPKKRQIIQSQFAVSIHKARRGRLPFDPSSVEVLPVGKAPESTIHPTSTTDAA